jgi:hypothetical protein
MQKITDISNELDKSPIYNMSLSSKELFHSNFWYWLSTIDVKLFVNIFVPNFKLLDEYKVSVFREKGNKDLTIIIMKNNITMKTIYIENKLKDMAHPEQLKKYVKATSDTYLLISLFEPPYILPDPWVLITYRELAERISRFSAEIESTYFKMIISDYENVISGLSRLTDELSIENSYNYFYKNPMMKNSFEALNRIRLLDIYLKYRASHTAYYVYCNYKKMTTIKILYGETNNTIENLIFNWGMNNKKATLDFYLYDPKTEMMIGVQIEDDEYRHFIKAEVQEESLVSLINNDLWFKEWKSARGLRFRKYKDSKNNQVFYYQFEKIKEEISYVDLFEKIANDLDYVIEKRDLISKLIGL